jgi:hypothetical protein
MVEGNSTSPTLAQGVYQGSATTTLWYDTSTLRDKLLATASQITVVSEEMLELIEAFEKVIDCTGSTLGIQVILKLLELLILIAFMCCGLSNFAEMDSSSFSNLSELNAAIALAWGLTDRGKALDFFLLK